MNTESATEDQKRRANEIVAMTLGLYAATTPRDDPGAHFGYQCALLAIMHGDAREARLRDPRPSFDQAGDAFRKLSEVVGAARHPFGN